MANPQAENGYMRIANEIWQQIMMSDFNREQRGILDLILRLSWGCGKKAAYIPKQKHFCLAGVYESHIKRELKWLESANVLFIDWDRKLFQFNKDFDTWRVSLVRGYDEEELQDLIRQNLQISKGDLLISKPDSQMSKPNLQISKSDLQISKNELTYKEDLVPANALHNADSGLSKESIKTIKDKEKTDRDICTTSSLRDTEAPTRGDRRSGSVSLSVVPTPAVSDFNDPVIAAWKKHVGEITPGQLGVLDNWREGPGPTLPIELIIKAIEITGKNGKTNVSYTEAILENWYSRGLTTLKEVELHERQRKKRASPKAMHSDEEREEAIRRALEKQREINAIIGGG